MEFGRVSCEDEPTSTSKYQGCDQGISLPFGGSLLIAIG